MTLKNKPNLNFLKKKKGGVGGGGYIGYYTWLKLIPNCADNLRTQWSKTFFSSCRSLVDTIYSLKDEVQELKQVSALVDEHWRNPLLQQNKVFPTKCTAWNSWDLLLMLLPPPTLQGQQAHEEDTGRGAASEERVGADHQESFEEHERPQLGWDQPLRSVFISGRQDCFLTFRGQMSN